VWKSERPSSAVTIPTTANIIQLTAKIEIFMVGLLFNTFKKIATKSFEHKTSRAYKVIAISTDNRVEHLAADLSTSNESENAAQFLVFE
jgi:hypothetical protein